MPILVHEYRGPAWWPLRRIADAGDAGGARHVVGIWFLLSCTAVLLAVIEAQKNWSGIPVSIGGISIPLTIYPPLAITLLLVVWLGPAWGVVPAYAATLTSALVVGMPVGAGLLFAFSTPVELLIIWGSMVVLETNPELPRRQDVVKFILAGVIAACASSLGGLIWIDYQQLDLLAAQRVWRGWVVGDVLQIILLVPVLRWVLPEIRAWTDRRLSAAPRYVFRHSTSVALVAGIVLVLAAVVLQGVLMASRSLAIPPDAVTASGAPLVPQLREIGLFLGLLTVVTAVTTTIFAAALARISEREGGAARRDALTGCLNRRAFYAMFDKEADRSRRLSRGLSLIYLDVDHFKRVNDTYGHETGDVVLRQLGVRVQGVIRENDALFRWGGEEFLILLPHTSPEEALALAERVRASVARGAIVQEQVASPIHVTVSLGTAGTDAFPADVDAMIATADAACYLAKRAGRNRVEDGTRLLQDTLELPANAT